MRAICGAIITAGALIGLGLTALGYGLRYGGPAFGPGTNNPNTNTLWGSPSLMVILIVLLIALLKQPRKLLPPYLSCPVNTEACKNGLASGSPGNLTRKPLNKAKTIQQTAEA